MSDSFPFFCPFCGLVGPCLCPQTSGCVCWDASALCWGGGSCLSTREVHRHVEPAAQSPRKESLWVQRATPSLGVPTERRPPRQARAMLQNSCNATQSTQTIMEVNAGNPKVVPTLHGRRESGGRTTRKMTARLPCPHPFPLPAHLPMCPTGAPHPLRGRRPKNWRHDCHGKKPPHLPQRRRKRPLRTRPEPSHAGHRRCRTCTTGRKSAEGEGERVRKKEDAKYP